MLRALVLRQVEMRSLTASNVSDRTIQKPEFMSGQTTVSIHALDRCNRRQLAALDSCRIERSGIPTARGGQWSAVEVHLVINRRNDLAFIVSSPRVSIYTRVLFTISAYCRAAEMLVARF
jgi:hypothetical protein